VSVQARLQQAEVTVDIWLDPEAREPVLESLREGLKAEIVFELRLYRRQRGLLAFLGDRLVLARRISQVASFDPFEDRYLIQREGRTSGRYAEGQAFLTAFLGLRDVRLAELQRPAVGGYYVLARAQLMPVKFVAPLSIITLFSRSTVHTSPWSETAIDAEGG
jgi:hypothetical protein